MVEMNLGEGNFNLGEGDLREETKEVGEVETKGEDEKKKSGTEEIIEDNRV